MLSVLPLVLRITFQMSWCGSSMGRNISRLINTKSIIETSDEAIEREDDINIDNNLNKVSCPVEGVENIKRFLSCNKCQTKIVAIPDNNIVKCSECGLTQLKTKCKQRVLATVLFANGVSTVMFDDKLRQLHNIFKETNSSGVITVRRR